MTRTILHVDMDAFYASVEQRDHPAFRGRPVIVGADPRGGAGRGVVAACSYEARKFGVHSALPISRAYRLCPEGVFVRPDFAKYAAVSRQIHALFQRYTRLVEPLSIDEAFLDVSAGVRSIAQAVNLATQLKADIWHTERLTASVGIGPNKFIAKIASDLRKPDGLVVVRPGEVQSFLDPLPVSRIWGVGPKTEERLRAFGLETIAQLRVLDRGLLVSEFGRLGGHLWELANGIDNRPVAVERKRKSLSHEETFPEDTGNRQILESTLEALSRSVAEGLNKRRLVGKTVTLKLRYEDFTTLTRQASLHDATSNAGEIHSVVARLFARHYTTGRKVRLLGVGLSRLEPEQASRQIRLF